MASIQELQQQTTNDSKKAYVRIVEQPAGKALRFRYECEGRSAGSIPGVSSTAENKTYPTIEIVGYKGRAVVVVSCVTKDAPYRPHPHNLVGKEGCKKGVCTLEINSETMRAVFSNLGIQCVKKKDIEAALKAREEIRVDPFKSGFAHRLNPASIDLNSVRLCFQVFTESEKKGSFTQPLPPIVSEPIYDKKFKCDLVIYRLCSCSATVLGNTQIILLCEKVAKEDIAVRLFEEMNGQTIWEAFGEFQHTDVHKQTAIAFKTPRYRKIDITEPAKVLIQLKRPSDGITSEALPFEYIPLDSEPGNLKRKRQRTNGEPAHLLVAQAQQPNGRKAKTNCWNHTNIPAIKTEPRDASPQPFVGMYQATSPHALSSAASAYPPNMPSSYQVAATAAVQSPQQYNAGGASNAAPLSMDTSNYSTFNQAATQQQSQQRHHQHYNGSSFGNVATHWETKFTPPVDGNSLSNLRNNNTLHVSNASAATPDNANWNLTSSHFHSHHLQQQQQQQQYPPQLPQGAAGMTTANSNGGTANTALPTAACNGVNNAHHNEHGLSNLLTIDSGQYVHIDSEDQQMLRLNSEDLRISDLSITT